MLVDCIHEYIYRERETLDVAYMLHSVDARIHPFVGHLDGSVG